VSEKLSGCAKKTVCDFRENSYALVIGFPEGGPRADVGEYSDFIGDFATNFCPCGGGNVGT